MIRNTLFLSILFATVFVVLKADEAKKRTSNPFRSSASEKLADQSEGAKTSSIPRKTETKKNYDALRNERLRQLEEEMYRIYTEMHESFEDKIKFSLLNQEYQILAQGRNVVISTESQAQEALERASSYIDDLQHDQELAEFDKLPKTSPILKRQQFQEIIRDVDAKETLPTLFFAEFGRDIKRGVLSQKIINRFFDCLTQRTGKNINRENFNLNEFLAENPDAKVCDLENDILRAWTLLQ